MALTLGRKPGEKLYVVGEDGKEIEIEVVKTEAKLDNYLRLRVKAPKEYKIIRGELR